MFSSDTVEPQQEDYQSDGSTFRGLLLAETHTP